MKKRAFILLAISLLFATAKAQLGKEAWNWEFGNGASLNFSSGAPVSGPASSISVLEGVASISDATTGQLLFYTDGTFAWNKNNIQMPNGFGMIGGSGSSTQAAMIVPKPGSSTIYYLVSADQGGYVGPNTGVHYSVVDMSLAGGLGDVVASSKNTLLTPPPTTEKLVGVKQCNGAGYWIITHPYLSNNFNAYLVTSSGITTTPVVSSVGTVELNTGGGFASTIGYLKASPNGQKLALGIYEDIPILEIYDFNASTGQVTNPITITYPGTGGPYGVSFSPDNSKVYAGIFDTDQLYQYDLSSGVPATIIASQTLIASPFGPGALQMGPDGKVYMSVYGNPLSVINSPNLLGSACNYVPNAIPISLGSAEDGLPNFIDATTNSIINVSNAVQCSTFTTDTLNAGPSFSTYTWSTGASTQSITINSPGTYWVAATTTLGCLVTDTIKAFTINPTTFQVLKDTVVCSPSGTYTANATYSGALGYLWNDGTTNPIKTFTVSGTYTVNISFPDGCIVTDSFHLTLHTKPTVNIGHDTTFCSASSLPVVLNAGVGSGYTYIWSTGATTQTISVTSGGSYSVDVTSVPGCSQIDSIDIFVVGTNNHYLFDTSLCNSSSFPLVLHAQHIPGTNNYYEWSTFSYGYSDSTTTVYNSGTYYLTIYADGFSCIITDTFNITLDTVHITNIVECNTFNPDTVSAGTGFVTYLWSTGATTYSTVINSVGTYWIKVTSGGGCTAVDTFNASVINPATIHPLRDTTYCSSYYFGYYYANAYVNGALSYVWSDGNTAPTDYLFASGSYTVDITLSGGCVIKDTFNLTINLAPDVFLFDQTYCSTSISTPIILDAGFGAGYTYSWSPTGATTETITVNPTAGNHSYTVEVTSAAGCSTIDSATITILNLPSGHQIDSTICSLSSLPILLTAPTYTGTTGNYYFWSSGGSGYGDSTTYDYNLAPLYLTVYVDGFSCVVTDTFNVSIDTARPHISDVLYCNIPKPDTVSAGLGYLHYLWSTGATTYSTVVNAVDSYSVQVTSTSNCVFTDTFVVKTLNLPLNHVTDTIICSVSNFPVSLNAPIITGGIYLWSNGFTSTTDAAPSSGNYYVNILANSGRCLITDSFNIALDTVKPHIGGLTYCNQTKPDTVSAGLGYTNYVWSTGATTYSTVINNFGTFSVTVTSVSGCVFTDTFLVSLYHVTKPNIPDVINCNKTPADVLNAGSGYSSYNWSTGSTSQSITVTAPGGSYWVVVKDNVGCMATDTAKVSYLTSPVINILRDTSVCNQISVTVDASYPNATSYLWSDGFTSPIHTINIGGMYWVVYTLTTTCVASDTFNLNIKNVKNIDSIPNIVTPNGDGRNDYIDFGTFQFPNMQLEIYNRWGIKIDESTNPNYVWKPSSTCDDGTYFYVIAYVAECDASRETKTIKGFITVLR